MASWGRGWKSFPRLPRPRRTVGSELSGSPAAESGEPARPTVWWWAQLVLWPRCAVSDTARDDVTSGDTGKDREPGAGASCQPDWEVRTRSYTQPPPFGYPRLRVRGHTVGPGALTFLSKFRTSWIWQKRKARCHQNAQFRLMDGVHYFGGVGVATRSNFGLFLGREPFSYK